jgi:cytochrome c biogenesis protein CcdA
MDQFWAGWFSALWLGILTSISPCPLASNIAAVSFLSKKITHPALVFISGIAYTVGRMVSYALVGWLVIHSLIGVPQIAMFLQKYMGKILGPVLIVTGLLLLEVVQFNLPSISLSHQHQNKLVAAGAPGAFALGLFFALAFCPVSAALFFGSLIPLALNHPAGSMLSFIYGIGTGLPVLAFAVAIALGVKSLSHWFRKITRAELYTRKITGATFILAGLYYIWGYWLQGGGL